MLLITLKKAVINVNITEFYSREKNELICDSERNDFNAAKSGIIYFDSSFQIIDLNREAENICSIQRSQVVGLRGDQALKHLGEKFVEIFHKDHYEDYSASIQIKNSAGFRYMYVDTLKIHNLVGEFIGFVLIIQDVTALQAALKQIQTTRMLISLGELAAGVAHHIRTPLTTINGYLQVMLNRLQGERYVVRRDVLEILLNETTYINQVIQELVLFAKPPIQKSSGVDVNRLLTEALLLDFRDLGGEKIQIDKHLADNLPFIYGDPNLLQQVFVNIMQNAIEAMPEEGVLSLRSWLHADLNMVVISVVDNGVGVPREIFSKVFEPFYTSKLDHMGLGLSIAHRIITEHGGFIHLSDEPGGGTKVHIYLPVVERSEHALLKVHQQILNLQ